MAGYGIKEQSDAGNLMQFSSNEEINRRDREEAQALSEKTQLKVEIISLNSYIRGVFVRSVDSKQEIQDEMLVVHFSTGALSSLDPYTTVYWPSQVQEFQKKLTNQFNGIGIKFSKEDGFVKINSVMPGTPAYKAGLLSGEMIYAINGEQINLG